MNITIVGYGNMGNALALSLTRAGHNVTLTGKDLDKAKAVAQKANAKVASGPAAVLHADLIISALPFAAQAEALKGLGPIAGKVVVDISNPVKPDFSGLQIGHSTSAAEELAKQLSGATVVKAFNTLFAQVFAEGPSFKDATAPVFYAGDDEAAKTKVRSVIESMGFTAVDAGTLGNSRYLEPMGMLNIWFGYMAQKGTGIAPAWISRA